ncbi:FecR family protein [Chitinophaga rhizosphaerae]|uniref:FecR family protein n=1 Tax=Chitinophaga rhizosphaerae TaxID=1864947 RepID=UPI000F8028D3|nr:FecR domain-containing protein [Chitinophaga rhizosphaerae]
MDTAQVKILAAKYLDGTATPEEAEALHDWYDQVNAGDTEIVTTEQETSLEDTRARMLRRMQEQMHPPATIRPLRRKWLPAAAAAALLLVAAGTYLLRPQGKPAGEQAAKLTPAAPANNSKGVTLTLGNGQVVELDSSADGYLAHQGGSTVSKEESLLVYGAEKSGEAPVINKLNVPKGEQYRLILPDGTRVWLNAASELQFPSAFAGEQRLVELHGEGYFEVAANAAQPFVVQTAGPRIEVLGTHFNVKAYPGEPGIQAALLEGSVRIVAGSGKSRVMRPGEVATVGEGTDISVLQDADAAQNVAWKDGLFVFRNADLSAILREIGRWYDVDIVYEGPVSHRRFTGKVSREYSLSETLSVLLASNLHFRQEGKKIIVLP